MTATTYELSEQSRSFIEAQAAAEGFASPGAYLDALVHQARVKKAKQALEARLLQAMNEPATEMTREDWDELRRRVRERGSQPRNGA